MLDIFYYKVILILINGLEIFSQVQPFWGEFPLFFLVIIKSKTLSILIDESGDFGDYNYKSPYYIVSLVFHDQDAAIEDNIKIFDNHIINAGYKILAVHSAPLIRKEEFYINKSLQDRKRLFAALFNFARKLPIHYGIIIVNKKECDNDIYKMILKISQNIRELYIKNSDYFSQFENIVLYYDNGQHQLNKILLSTFSALSSHITFRQELPEKYKLFQLADLICTLCLTNKKGENNNLSNSEKAFFKTYRDFKKDFLKPIFRKKLQ